MLKFYQIIEFPRRIPKFGLILIICLVQFLSHANYLKVPATGHHVWRQCNTLAVARNYSEIDMNIFYPRIDKNYGTNGITGPQFTSYDYSLALLYRVFGFSQFTHRWLSLIISFIIIWGLFKLVNQFVQNTIISFWSTFSVLGIPEFYYHSFNAVPDILAMACMIWAWYFYNRMSQIDNASWKYALFSAGLLALAGMTKLMFLIPGFIFLGDIWNRRAFPGQIQFKSNLNYWPKWILIASISLIFSYAWYRWAHYLTYLNWLNEFVHEIRFFNQLDQVFEAFIQNITMDLFETWVGYPLVFLVFGGCFYAVKNKSLIHDKRMLLFAAATLLYYIVMQKQLQVHGYYILLFVPFIVLAIAYFLKQFNISSIESKRNNEVVKASELNSEEVNGIVNSEEASDKGFKKGLVISCILIIVSPVWSWLRMHHNWTEKGARVSQTLLRLQNSNLIVAHTMEQPLWIVGPDQSGCVNFYYLHAKGFPWYNLEEKGEIFNDYLCKGAKGFITDQPKEVQKMAHQFSWKIIKINQLEEFYWITVEK
jgi:hypothetical protein